MNAKKLVFVRFLWLAIVQTAVVVGARAEDAPDLSTPAVQALRKELIAAREKLAAERTMELDALLSKQVKLGQEQLTRARVSGNVTQQAVARTAIQIFEKALERFKKDGVFELPVEVRREVQSTVSAVRSSGAGVEAVRAAALTALDSKTAQSLRKLLAEQGTPVASDVAAAALLPTLVSAEAKAETPVGGGGPSTNSAAVAAGTAAALIPKDPEEIGSNGGATDWEPLLRVGVQVAELEIVSIPVLGVEKERQYNERSQGTDGEVAVRIVPQQALIASEGTVLFRAMSLPGKAKAEVMVWPSASNGWMLELRCRPQSLGPATLQLEVSRATAQLKALAGVERGTTSVSETSVPKVVVKIVTRPEGASVLVGGRAQLQGRQPIVTPCEVAIPATGAEVLLRKRGHLDGQLGKIVPTEGQVVTATLTADPAFIDRKLRVQAIVGGVHSGVTLKEGQHVRLSVEGEWSCGSRGEMVGPAGYAIEKYGHYYLNPELTPRVTTESSYGALLVRVGATGAWKPVGKELTLKADVSGPVVFEINEAAVKGLRRDNRGALQVHVQSVTR